ncbi:hypothetical protein CEUSTIGMA_g4259.t1 [Chlamydomonas eustigma]|uniref:Uncharacterized protein n=1 Tax=Chlamydomonas eustigma TaxID=1157962 RepID=A0A250X152_9CHLO|nr:hypothetical protein CEUSTIGMA_g4259.t1 [Chlamydomonas eustigma]|eukprot:GAX76813.1 hypothetical protein CEUSTIGMA_g4259.t1 [Chlamydomonas eustigma]
MAAQVSTSYISRVQLDRIKDSVLLNSVDTNHTELDRIKDSVLLNSVDTNHAERLRLKQQSDERASRWPNTLNVPEKREQGRTGLLLKKWSDRRWTELSAEQRRLQIEHANIILFDESDSVKGFHSNLQKSGTIQENELLVDYKKQIRVLQKAQEAAFVEQQRQALELAEAAEPKKFEEERERALKQKRNSVEAVGGHEVPYHR